LLFNFRLISLKLYRFFQELLAAEKAAAAAAGEFV